MGNLDGKGAGGSARGIWDRKRYKAAVLLYLGAHLAHISRI